MALTLPGWLVEAIRFLGYEFPQTNEDTLQRWAEQLRQLESSFHDTHTTLTSAVQHVQHNNAGRALDAFTSSVGARDADLAALNRFAEGTGIAAFGCEVCAAATVAFKGVVLFQLGVMAAALATGPGALLAKKGVEYAIDKALEYAINQIMGE